MWFVLREIQSIAELSEMAKGKLVTVSESGTDLQFYLTGLHPIPQVGEDNVKRIEDGVLALAAVR